MSARYAYLKSKGKFFCLLFVNFPLWLPGAGQGLALMSSLVASDPEDPASFLQSYATRQARVQPESETKRPVKVEDAIRMIRIAGPGARNHIGGELPSDFASFSPNRRRFVIVTKNGNLEQNTNEYAMLLYNVDDVFDHPHARTLVSFASSSNREAINDITWLADNNTILFLGERGGETTQVYSIECSSGKLTKLTNHPASILKYSASAQGEEIAYIAERSVDLVNENVLRNGFPVSDEKLSELSEGHLRYETYDLVNLVRKNADTVKSLHVLDGFLGSPIFLSPDGRYLIVTTNVREIPSIWSEYRDGILQWVLRSNKVSKNAVTFIPRYELIDVESGQSRALVDAPISYQGTEARWLSDSRSVALTGVHLPLGVTDPVEKAVNQAGMFAVEVKIPSLEVVKITDRDMKLVGWNRQTQVLELVPRTVNDEASIDVHYYKKTDDRWDRVKVTSELTGDNRPEILNDQGLNIPPRVVVLNPKTGQKETLLDLNPQFKELAFGKVEDVKWTDGHSHVVEGGLYLPPDYVPGRKYPLVIQTHGFKPGQFWVDGPWTTGFAAQPLAGKGFVVLQVPDGQNWNEFGTPEEASSMMEIYERAIDYLSNEGIIDSDRVGLIGFSRTCWYVKYALTHSRYHFSAAAVADGFDGGYFQFAVFGNDQYRASLMENQIGVPPMGEGLSLWLKRAPGFLLDQVRTPLRIQAIGPPSLLLEWEWFTGLSRLNKPVDMVYIPTGDHILQKPWDRMVSQQGNVDWFCFWLKHEEDPDQAKSEQYTRWHHLRDLAKQDLKERSALSQEEQVTKAERPAAPML